MLDAVEVRRVTLYGSLCRLIFIQSDRYIYIATEMLTPLAWHVRRKALSAETIKWGLFSIAVGDSILRLELLLMVLARKPSDS